MLVILVLAELRRKHASLQQIRAILPSLKTQVNEYLSTDRAARSDLYLVTDMQAVHFVAKAESVIQLFKEATEPMLVVSISDHIKRLSSEADSPAGKKQMRLHWLL